MQANFNLWTEVRGQRRLADFLVETMQLAGVTHAFAMPAESLNPILDAIRKSGTIQLFTVRHEGNGALMASACAKLTGRLGVCMGTAGPGASHLPLGTYDAKADGAPLLAITGQVPVSQVGFGGFQEIDSVALFHDSVVLISWWLPQNSCLSCRLPVGTPFTKERPSIWRSLLTSWEQEFISARVRAFAPTG
jgi:2-succinyl-5-enolpyruvyl-6-hydroxy-3-cyclohexene-1-carboxylate synthase